MDAVEIRTAVPADAEAVADYHHRCFAASYAAQLAAGEVEAPDAADTSRQQHERFLPGSGFDTRVAVVDGTPIGHVTVCGPHLVHLFVDPDHQHRGIGRHLLAVGEALMAKAGHREVELHTRVDNLSAIAFYEQAGWTVTDQVITTVEHGTTYDERVLTKLLPA